MAPMLMLGLGDGGSVVAGVVRLVLVAFVLLVLEELLLVMVLVRLVLVRLVLVVVVVEGIDSPSYVISTVDQKLDVPQP